MRNEVVRCSNKTNYDCMCATDAICHLRVPKDGVRWSRQHRFWQGQLLQVLDSQDQLPLGVPDVEGFCYQYPGVRRLGFVQPVGSVELGRYVTM